MTERWYRLVQGFYLLIALYIENTIMIYTFMGVLTFEAITNLRIPALFTRMGARKDAAILLEDDNECELARFSIDSERLLRIVVVIFLLLSYVLFPEPIWFFPWFVAAMLFMAGITNICPMVMMFQYIGFR